MTPTVTQAPNGQGLVWGLGEGVPATFPSFDAAWAAVRAARNVPDVEALTSQPLTTQEA